MADNLAKYVNDIFNQSQTVDGGLSLLAVYAYAFQIYCDFSSYTERRERRGQDARIRAGAELQPAVLRHQPPRLLGAVAYQPVHMVARTICTSLSAASRGASGCFTAT